MTDSNSSDFVSTKMKDSDFVDLQGDAGAAKRERHRLYLLALMKIACHFWNGNKKGLSGSYPLNCQPGEPGYNPGTYLGHNIAAIAVRPTDNEIMDFDFNHNEAFDSSVEHAESRLIRRLFSLTQVNRTYNNKCLPCNDGRNASKKYEEKVTYGNLLSGFTVYTTLESCTQCTGIMNLGGIAEVVYLHTDPGMTSIGNIVYNMNRGKTSLYGPKPIDAYARTDFPFHRQLDEAYAAFQAQQKRKEGEPFYITPAGVKEYSDSITSFLCTKAAYLIYKRAADEFDALAKFKVSHENLPVLGEIQDFVAYATNQGKRGTPHRA